MQSAEFRIGPHSWMVWSLVWQRKLYQSSKNFQSHGLIFTANVEMFTQVLPYPIPVSIRNNFPPSSSLSQSNKSSKPCYGYNNLLINFSAALIYSITAGAPQWQQVLQAGGQFDWESNRAQDLTALQQGETNAPVCEKCCIYNTHMPE